ncbi:hypothetical protein OROGR_024515 [Orobanche gracilis]
MTDEGEKTCPLCAEEMDLTDQQLKPCMCGYEICVWCWHHIMDMAEKDETEGRCPACRTPYNKEKIVGTAAKCERLVLEMNVEKKLRSRKGKAKMSEGRKQLESVRVVQRNLVYVVGLPLNFADEELLQRKEYFSQYGKVLKVSISRTATGAIQQFANSTCSVYITYSKEEEAVRCIQSVHGFVLSGRSLRVCFGTTKYCHAWLRNMPCSNLDCLYLHEIGSQEDSFTKDEIVSAYTRFEQGGVCGFFCFFDRKRRWCHVLRLCGVYFWQDIAGVIILEKGSRVQQITSSSNSTQQRSGNVLPPPADEYRSNSSAPSGKPITKNAANTKQNSAFSAGVCQPNSSSGKSAALPSGASWGTRPSSNSQPLPASTPYSNLPPKQEPGMCNGPVTFFKEVSSTSETSSLQSDTGKKVHNEESIMSREKTKTGTLNSKDKESETDGRIAVSDSSVASIHHANLPSSRQPHSPPTTTPQPEISNTVDSSVLSSGPMSGKNHINHTDGNMENVCSSILSLSIHENQQLQNGYVGHIREPLVRQTSRKAANFTDNDLVASFRSDSGLGMKSEVTQANWHEKEDDVLSFDNQRINDPELATSGMPEFSHDLNLSKHSNIHSHGFNNTGGSLGIGFNRKVVDRNDDSMVPTFNFHSGHPENVLNNFEANDAQTFSLFPSKERGSLLGRYEGEASNAAVNMGESSIISNILSMDFDPFDESLTSPQNLAKLLSDTDKRQAPFGATGPWKIQNSNQSRFSFAREGVPISHVSGSGRTTDYYEQTFKQRPFGHDISSSNGLYLERSAPHNGLPVFSCAEPDNLASSQSHLCSNKLLASRSQMSVPPGFSGPSRIAPPPGFTSHQRTEQIYESFPGNQMIDSSSLLRNQYQTPSSGSTFSNGDIEFIDPAILAVGKGTLPVGVSNPGLDLRSNFSPQFSTYEDTRFQSLLQRSFIPHQNQRFTDMVDNFATLGGNAYGIPSRIVDQNISNNIPPFSQFNLPQSRNGLTSNGQWDGWSEAQSGNNLSMSELLRTERLGLNKFYGGYEDSKIETPSSRNLYDRAYGI